MENTKPLCDLCHPNDNNPTICVETLCLLHRMDYERSLSDAYQNVYEEMDGVPECF